MSYFPGNCEVVCAYGVDAKHIRAHDLKVKDHANIPTLNTQKIQTDQLLSLNANTINLNSTAAINTTGATLTVNNNLTNLNSQNTAINGQSLFIYDQGVSITATQALVAMSPEVALVVKTLTVQDVSSVNTLTITVQSGAPPIIASEGALDIETVGNLNIVSSATVDIVATSQINLLANNIVETSTQPINIYAPYTVYNNVSLPSLSAAIISGGYFLSSTGATLTTGTFLARPIQGGIALTNLNMVQVSSATTTESVSISITVPTGLSNIISLPSAGMYFSETVPLASGPSFTVANATQIANISVSTGSSSSTISLNIITNAPTATTYTTGNFTIEYLS